MSKFKPGTLSRAATKQIEAATKKGDIEKVLDILQDETDAMEAARGITIYKLRAELATSAHDLLPLAEEQARKGKPGLYRAIIRLAMRDLTLDRKSKSE